MAEQYRADHGLTGPTLTNQVEIDEEALKFFADEFEYARHEPTEPLAQASYQALVSETNTMLDYMGDITYEAWTGEGEPYANSTAMTNDALLNRHMWYYATDTGTFGEGELDQSNVLLAPSGRADANGRELLNNDVFRIVHDFFGHTQNNLKFGPKGELNAFLEHAGMYSKDALPALAAETLMQNAWVNFGKHMRRDDGTIPTNRDSDYVPIRDRRFADQKNFAAPWRVIDRAFKLRDQADAAAGQKALARSYNRFRESLGLAPTAGRIEPVPGADGTVRASHWGKRKGLKNLSPSHWGDNWDALPASEKARVGDAPNRVYFGLSVDEGPWGYEREAGLGPNRYEARLPLASLYDFHADPAGLTAKAQAASEAAQDDYDATYYENEIQAAGFKGYWVNDPGLGLVAVAFDKTPVVAVADPRILEQGPRGSVSFTDDGALIRLFKTSNTSTIIHEGGHTWVENLARDAEDPNANQEVRDDWQAVRSWWSENVEQAAEALKDDATIQARIAEDPAYLQKIAQTFGMSEADPAVRLEAIRPFHEMFARASERYMMEGKAPSAELRGPFAKFATWLAKIYKTLADLDVPMTDEIRGVFDRLLAAPAAVQAIKEQQRLTTLSAEALGMSEAEYASYLKLDKDADDTAHDRLLGQLMADIRRQKTAEWKTERAELVGEFLGEVDQAPDIKLIRALAKDVRISRAVLADASIDPASLYNKGEPYVTKNGLHPDDVAEAGGFDSGEEMIRALERMKVEQDQLAEAGRPTDVRKGRAEDMADGEMTSRHGDMLNDGSIGDEALDVINDIKRSGVVATELRALIRKAGSTQRVWSPDEYKAWAQAKLAGMRLDQIKPDSFARAERKAGDAFLKAMGKKNYQDALDAKFRQMLNLHLFNAARRARKDVATGTALFDRIVKAKDGTISKTRNMDMVGAARAILAPYGFERAKNDADYMAKVAMYDPELWADLEQGVTAAIAGAQPVGELTYDKFTSLRELVGQLWVASRESRQIEIDGEKLDVEFATTALGDRLEANGIPNRPGDTRAPTKGEHTMRLISGLRAALRRTESWATATDGGNKGPFRTYIWNPISEAATRYRTAKARYLTEFVQLLAPAQAGLKRGRIAAPELNYTFGFANNGVGKGELLHAILHTGNESNKRKLLLGRGWATEDANGVLDTRQWDAFVDRMHAEGVLTQVDYDLAQSVWDLLERMKPDAQRAHRQVFGRYFAEVTATPFSTPFGEYAGGYVPAITDTFLVQEQALNAAQDAIESGNDAAMFPSPARGFTKSRVDYNKPLALDLGLLPQHMDKVLKFTHMTAPTRQVLRVLKERGFASKLEAYDPVAVPDLLLPWLNRAAKQIVETPSKGSGGKAADTFFRAVRHRTGMGIMTANVSNTVQQLIGWAPAALKVRKRHLVKALWRVTRNPAQMGEDIAALSGYMATRTGSQVHEVTAHIEQLLLDPSRYDQVTAFAQQHAYILQSMTQNLVDLVTWSGAHEQAQEEGQSDEEAVRFADAAIRETQSSLAPEDISRFETGSPFVRMFTQFYNYFGAQSNLLLTEFGNANTAARFGYIYLAGVMLPAVLADAIRRTFGEGWDDEDDDGYLDTFMDLFFGSQFRYLAGMVPVAGPALVTLANRFNDKTYDDKIAPSPAISTIDQLAGTPFDVYKLATEGKKQKAVVRDTTTLLTLATGNPWFSAAGRPLGYLADINQGKVKPTGPVDFARGLITGSASKASKVQ